MTNNTPGMTLNQLANLPMASSTIISLPGRSLVNTTATGVLKLYDIHGNP